MKINHNYTKLEENYLFTEIARRTSEFSKAHPQAKIIKLGIGDVTRPLSTLAAQAMIKGIEELTHAESFRGYGPELGYGFAKDAVIAYYGNYGVTLHRDDITICDGSGSDIAYIPDLFTKGAHKGFLPDPLYSLHQAT